MNTCSLQSIKICDFKSYKGLVEISDFNQFTAVIGPNGSGKSNFMDAVGFALGESHKAIRVNDLSELIHGSTIKKPVATKCYVALVFLLNDGRNKSFKRTVITGTARRNKYEIDETVVSSEVYQTELNRIGILDHGKSCLIFQGNIEGIAMQKPKERCSFFERISGSLQFHEEYNTSKMKMQKTQEKVQSIFEQQRILGHEVKMMSIEKKNASVFAELEKKERELKQNQQLFYLFHVEKDIEEVNIVLQSKIRKIEELNIARSEANGLLDRLKEGIKNIKQIEIQMKEETAVQETELDLQKANVIEKEEKITYLNEKKDRISKSLAVAETKCETHRKNIRDLNEDKQIFETELAVHLSDSASGSDSPDSSRSLDEQQFKEYSKLKLEAGKHTSFYTQEQNSKLRELQKDQDRLDNETRKKTEINATIQLCQKHLESIQERKDSLKNQVDVNKNSIMEKEKYRDTLEKEIAEARAKLPALQNEKDNIIKTLKNAKDDKYWKQVADLKTERIEQLRKNFPGVIGRLIDLCEPRHPRYQIAFVKILGSDADTIVVENTTTAKQCILFLKIHMLGREKFIPLDNIDPQHISERLRDIRDSPNVKLAYDVIKFPPEIDLAVRFVMKNTLICDSIRDVRELSASRETEKGRILGHTCVSLDGTMFKKNGMISGGMADLARQAKKWNDKVILEMKLRKPMVEDELKAVLQKIRRESTVVLLNSQIESLRKCTNFIQNHLNSIEDEQQEIEAKLRDLKAKEEEISNTIQEINVVISAKEKAVNDIQKKINNVQDKVFRNFCQEIGYKNIRDYENKDLRIHQQRLERIQQLRDHLNRINNLIEFEKTRNPEEEVSNWRKFLAQTQAELKKATEEKFTLLEEIKNIESNLHVERSKLEKKRAEIEEAKKEYRHYHQIVKHNTKQIDLLAKEINEYRSNLNKKRREILRTCQIKQIQIPLKYGNLDSFDPSQEVEEEADIEIDYSDLPEDYKEREKIAEIEQHLNEEIHKVQGHLERFEAPNQKAEKVLKTLMQQQREIKRKLKEYRAEAKFAVERLEIVKKRRTEMLYSFITKVTDVLDNIYKRMTKSDSAQAFLCAQNPEEPYLDGIDYMCIAPGKKALTMDGLSGGEKSIAALALLFAIQKAKPAPFFLLDEVDAALDPINIGKIADCIKEEKQFLQFIVISLKLKLFCAADTLVGITTNEGKCSQSAVFVFDLQKYDQRIDYST